MDATDHALAYEKSFWSGKRVFLTGHTGFKGGWLALWLAKLGSVVHGYSLEPNTTPNLFSLAGIKDLLSHQIADIRNAEALQAAMIGFKPDIVMHLAAQPILRLSYDQPVETYATNVMGTVHLLEAVRKTDEVRVTLVVTSDKCYENKEHLRPYRESDALGGYDPYSSSKGCAELVTSAFGRSYFKDRHLSLASVRAGNVIGGGDWAPDRLMTDIIKSLANECSPILRHPRAIRPWQHVLEPLSGYLRAVEYLWHQQAKLPECWNFGPEADSTVSVEQLARQVCHLWGSKHDIKIADDVRHLHEASILRLDSTKAHAELGWFPKLSLNQTIDFTVSWYREQLKGADMSKISRDQITAYENIDNTPSIIAKDSKCVSY
jgi:CDP-glucose 4,6-dehydratase